jgi:uncharacterized protein (TIGR02246 family)
MSAETRGDARADEAAIRKLIDDWMQATAQGYLARVLSLMSDDVAFMTAGREPFGKKEFAAASAGMKDVKLEGVAQPVEIQVLGDWGEPAQSHRPDHDPEGRPAAETCGLHADDSRASVRRPLGHHARREPDAAPG